MSREYVYTDLKGSHKECNSRKQGIVKIKRDRKNAKKKSFDGN